MFKVAYFQSNSLQLKATVSPYFLIWSICVKKRTMSHSGYTLSLLTINPKISLHFLLLYLQLIRKFIFIFHTLFSKWIKWANCQGYVVFLMLNAISVVDISSLLPIYNALSQCLLPLIFLYTTTKYQTYKNNFSAYYNERL